MISILISRMMSIFIKLYSDLFIFCPKKPFLIDHFQFFSKANMKTHKARSLLYFFYDSFAKFRMIDAFPFFIFYNHILRSSVFLLSSVLIPYGDCFIMNRIPGCH